MSTSFDYPIQDILPDLKATLEGHSLLLLSAPPGSGKTTVLPLLLRTEEWIQGKKILILQPRRIAAKSVAERMAELLQEPVGGIVGYRVRQEKSVSTRTQIEVITEGILTRMMQSDPELSEVGLLIFDEYHERSLPGELALVLAREVQESLRPDLRILVMSATLASGSVARAFSGVPFLQGGSPSYPVEILVLPVDSRKRLAEQLLPIVRQAIRETDRDVLVFLPGVGEIKALSSLLHDQGSSDLRIVELFGDLPFGEQRQAILPDTSGRRKVILSTPIAETSITIEGVQAVVDSGLEKVLRYRPGRGGDTLELQRISQDSAVQRAGRAGRTGPGRCYRAYQGELLRSREPEILRADLTPLLLELAAWGVRDWRSLAWVDPPPEAMMSQAEDCLKELGLLDEEGRILELGRKALSLSVHPRFGAMILHAAELGASERACDLAAIMEEKDFLAGGDSSIDSRLEILHALRGRTRISSGVARGALERVDTLSRQLRQCLSQTRPVTNSRTSAVSSGFLLSFAFPERVAQRRSSAALEKRFLMASGSGVRFRGEEELSRSPYIVVLDFLLRGSEGEVTLAARIDESEIQERFRKELHRSRELTWDEKTESVLAEEIAGFRALVFERKPIQQVPEEEKATILLQGIRLRGDLSMLNWSEGAKLLRSRMSLFERIFPEYQAPSVAEEFLLSSAEDWLFPSLLGKSRFKHLSEISLHDLLLSRYSWSLRKELDAKIPERIQLPSGKIRLLEVDEHGGLVLPATVQELFGWKENPRFGEGRVPLTFHILSPARRPIQVTNNLASFWKNTYQEVRKELRGRYPKHRWPEDPTQPILVLEKKK